MTWTYNKKDRKFNPEAFYDLVRDQINDGYRSWNEEDDEFISHEEAKRVVDTMVSSVMNGGKTNEITVTITNSAGGQREDTLGLWGSTLCWHDTRVYIGGLIRDVEERLMNVHDSTLLRDKPDFSVYIEIFTLFGLLEPKVFTDEEYEDIFI